MLFNVILIFVSRTSIILYVSTLVVWGVYLAFQIYINYKYKLMNQWNASDYNGDISGHIRNFLSMTMSYSGNTCSSWGITLAASGLWYPRLGLFRRGTITSRTETCSRPWQEVFRQYITHDTLFLTRNEHSQDDEHGKPALRTAKYDRCAQHHTSLHDIYEKCKQVYRFQYLSAVYRWKMTNAGFMFILVQLRCIKTGRILWVLYWWFHWKRPCRGVGTGCLKVCW